MDAVIELFAQHSNSSVLCHGHFEPRCNPPMKTAPEHRLDWLRYLVTKYGSVAALNRALAREDRDATLNQILNGAPNSKTGKPRQMGDRIARGIEEKLGLPRGSLDMPRKADPFEQGFEEAVSAPPVLVTPAGLMAVRMLEIRPSAGPGAFRPDDDPIIGSMTLNPRWVRRHLPTITSAANLVTVIAHGRSMEPTFCDGAILLVDHGERRVTVDGIYVLAWEDELYVKRVTRRLPDGALMCTSDSPLHGGFTIENGDRERVDVLGRVVWTFDSRGV